MSFKVLSGQISSVDVVEMCMLHQIKSKKELQIDNERVDMKFMLKSCVVKYTPEKYDKITVSLNKECIENMKKLQKILTQECPELQPFIKDANLGLKISPEQKVQLKQGGVSIADSVDLIIDFNHIWRINGKDYASFKLVQFKKIDVPEINYFEEYDLDLVN